MLIISHRQGDASFEKCFVTISWHLCVAMNVKLHRYHMSLLPSVGEHTCFLCHFFLFSYNLQSRKINNSCKPVARQITSCFSQPTKLWEWSLFCGKGFCVSCSLWFYLFRWQVASTMCLLFLFLFFQYAHILISSDQSKANNVVFHWICRFCDTRNECNSPEPIQNC